ncbi:MAG: OsmC family protein [Anaerolineae bacterium]|nr:OsmC family protein [Anaerolineae bacterium]
MPVRKAEAIWQGDLKSGKGTMALASGAFEGAYSFSTRFEDEPGTNPEELIGAAHAGCFSMAFSNELAKAGFVPDRVHTVAKVHLDKTDSGFKITRIELITDAKVPHIDEAQFQEIGAAAKVGCPVSQLLGPGAEITLAATLEN